MKHLGVLLWAEHIAPAELTVGEAAKKLGVSRTTLSRLLNGHQRMSPKMAIKVAEVFGGSAEDWVQRQALYDLAQARRNQEHENV